MRVNRLSGKKRPQMRSTLAAWCHLTTLVELQLALGTKKWLAGVDSQVDHGKGGPRASWALLASSPGGNCLWWPGRIQGRRLAVRSSSWSHVTLAGTTPGAGSCGPEHWGIPDRIGHRGLGCRCHWIGCVAGDIGCRLR